MFFMFAPDRGGGEEGRAAAVHKPINFMLNELNEFLRARLFAKVVSGEMQSALRKEAYNAICHLFPTKHLEKNVALIGLFCMD